MSGLLVSCSKDDITNNHYIVEHVEVKLNTHTLLTEVDAPFQKKTMSTTSTSTSVVLDTSYAHVIPNDQPKSKNMDRFTQSSW